ncbi:MAG: TRAP transporter small permease [Deltaproteobacteria bacterium]|nr:TRAP transporter small permease [Deltaproteobacteria bacterium]
MKMFRKFGSIFDRAVDVLAILAAIIFIFAMVSVNYGVIMRYFLHRSQSWVVEITSMSLVYIAFLSTTWLLKKDGHVTMDLSTVLLKPKPLAILNIITSLVCALMFLLFTIYGTYITWDHFERGVFNAHSVLRIPTGYTLVIIPIGCVFLFIQILRRAWNIFLSIRRGPGTEQ